MQKGLHDCSKWEAETSPSPIPIHSPTSWRLEIPKPSKSVGQATLTLSCTCWLYTSSVKLACTCEEWSVTLVLLDFFIRCFGKTRHSNTTFLGTWNFWYYYSPMAHLGSDLSNPNFWNLKLLDPKMLSSPEAHHYTISSFFFAVVCITRKVVNYKRRQEVQQFFLSTF
jgi:hypothetical protein